MFNPKTALIFIIVAFAVGFAFYIFYPTPEKYDSGNGNGAEPVACTMEAKLCPDGSYVGRVGPNCEFEACPIPEGAQFEDGVIE